VATVGDEGGDGTSQWLLFLHYAEEEEAIRNGQKEAFYFMSFSNDDISILTGRRRKSNLPQEQINFTIIYIQ